MARKIARLIHVHRGASAGNACNGGSCPSVYETTDGTYVIIGRRMSAEEKAGLPMAGGEDALEVPRELLKESAPKLM